MTYDAMQGAFEFLGVEPVEIGDIRGCAGIRGCAKEVVEQIVDTAADRAIDNLINQAAPELPINYSPGGSCSAPGANSFVPGTRVLMADGTTKPIEQVKVGDHVLATDPESGRTEAKPVITLITGNGHKNLVDLTIDTDGPHGDSTDTLTATADHPFWVPALRKWLPAAELQPGMWLQTAAGTYVQITALTKRSTVQRVHNLTVDGLHTYHVVAGDQAILVHNDRPRDARGRFACDPDTLGPGELDEDGKLRGTNKSGEVTSRAKFRAGTVDDAWNSAPPGPNGGVICARQGSNCVGEVFPKPGPGRPAGDLGHSPSWTNRQFDPNVTRREVIDNYQEGVKVECIPCNRGAGNRYDY